MVQSKILALSFSPGACGMRRSSQSGVQKQKAGRDDVVREAHLHAIEQCERTRMLVSSRLSILWTCVVQAILVGFARGWESWKGWLTPLSHLNGRAMIQLGVNKASHHAPKLSSSFDSIAHLTLLGRVLGSRLLTCSRYVAEVMKQGLKITVWGWRQGFACHWRRRWGIAKLTPA